MIGIVQKRFEKNQKLDEFLQILSQQKMEALLLILPQNTM
jgi:hypothetical protein